MMKLAMAAALGTAITAAAAAAQQTTMQDRNVRALKEMIESVNAGDARRYARLYAADAVITIRGSGRLEGRDAIEQHEVELMRQFPGARLAFYDVWQKTPMCVVHYAVNGSTPAGQAMGHEGLLFFRFNREGLIEDEHRYLDSLTPMAQLGAFGAEAASTARPIPKLPTDLRALVAADSADEDRNVALVREMFSALNSKDEAAFLSRAADDVSVDEVVLPRAFTRREGAERWFEMWTTAVARPTLEVTTILGVRDFVLVEAVLRGTLIGPVGPVVASNQSFAVHRGFVVQLRGGRAVRIAAFMNGKELAEAAGQWPPRSAKK